MAIPGSMADVSAEWIEECIGRGKLKNINLVPMGEGVGMMSSMSVILMPGRYSIVSTLSVVNWGYVLGALMFANLGLSKFVLLFQQ